MEELSGLTPDPDCLHCVIAPILDRFMLAHPEKPLAQLAGEVLQIAAELIASDRRLHNLDLTVYTAQSLLGSLIRQARQSFKQHGRVR